MKTTKIRTGHTASQPAILVTISRLILIRFER
jgi:hypothetical protein